MTYQFRFKTNSTFLLCFDMEDKLCGVWGPMDAKGFEWFFKTCETVEAAQAAAKKHEATLVQCADPLTKREQAPVTFDDLWEKYGYKVDKLEAQKVWAKMKAHEQEAAYKFIDKYEAQIKSSGVAKKYAKTYLRTKPWIQ